MFAGSPFSDGQPSGYKSFRAAVWLETDEDRCGLLPFVFEPGFGFRDYVEWALDVPMFFVVRDGAYHSVEALTVPALPRPKAGRASRRLSATGRSICRRCSRRSA